MGEVRQTQPGSRKCVPQSASKWRG